MKPSLALAHASSVSPYLLLALTPLFWASNWIVGRGLHEEIPPMAMTFYRWLFAIIILAPFAWRHVRRDWPVIRRNRRVMLLLGLVGVGFHNALAYLGLNYTTAINGVILNSFIPIMIIALSWIFLRQRLSALQLAGVTISLLGVLAILSRGSIATLAALELNHGDLLVMMSMLLWSIYTICLRWKPAGLHTLSFLFVIACIGDAAVLPLYAAEAAFGAHMAFSAANLAALASIGLFSSVLAYIFWNRGVEQVGASVAGLFLHLMPVFGTLLAWLFLGEHLQSFHLVGIVLIMAGIYVTSRQSTPPVPAAPE
ncbi:MAG: DMT family transporter [Betaproteobacteria bacterium]